MTTFLILDCVGYLYAYLFIWFLWPGFVHVFIRDIKKIRRLINLLKKMENRYVIKEGSSSGHCCFEFSIIDTKSGFSTEKLDYFSDCVAETFDKESAELIASALNKAQ